MPRVLSPVLAAVAFIAPLGCQEVIGLGEEPSLGCGLPPARNVTCRDCMTATCCEAQRACSEDEECAEGAISCLAGCLSTECSGACIPQHTGNLLFRELVVCGIQCQEHCAIKRVCESLGAQCCQNLDPGVVQDGCFDIVRMNDEAECTSARATLADVCSSE